MFMNELVPKNNTNNYNGGGKPIVLYAIKNTENKTLLITSNTVSRKYFIKINEIQDTGKDRLIVKHTLNIFDIVSLKTRIDCLDGIEESKLHGVILLENRTVKIFIEKHSTENRYALTVQHIVNDNIRRTDRFSITTNIRNQFSNSAISVPVYNILKSMARAL